MNARIVDNVGILKLKMLVMESIKEFPRGIAGVTATTKCSIGHPNGLSFGSTPPALDQAISLRAHDGECERSPGPGLKQQASSAKHQASSFKLQANQNLVQVLKHQATSL